MSQRSHIRSSQGGSQVRSTQGGSQARGTQGGSQARKGQSSAVYDNAEIITAAERAVHFILAHAGAHITPIKHQDLKKCVFPDMRVDEPLRLTRKMLLDSFGYHFQEIPGKAKTYHIINSLNNEHVCLPKNAEAYRTLLSLVLGYIFMNRQEVEEKNLRKFLMQMNIDPNGYHPYFGAVNELLFKTNPIYVRDQYIYITSKDQGNFYEWGERSKLEVDRRRVLNFVCEVLDCDPDDWKLQQKDCESDEEEEVMDTED